MFSTPVSTYFHPITFVSVSYLIPRCNLVSFPPSQHRGEGRQVSLLVSSQHVFPQAVSHLKPDGREHVLHLLL